VGVIHIFEALQILVQRVLLAEGVVSCKLTPEPVFLLDSFIASFQEQSHGWTKIHFAFIPLIDRLCLRIRFVLRWSIWKFELQLVLPRDLKIRGV
jgi:hypothetical protein